MLTRTLEKCIALMEDIDAAFSQTLNREPDNDDKDENDPKKDDQKKQPPPPSTSRITLSGLLNALDGVAAQEGRILFATTNKYSSLDPALCRPGRMDIHIEFKLASKYQALELYRCFYLPDADEEDEGGKKSKKDKDASDSGYSSADEKAALVSSSTTPVKHIEPVNFNGSSHGHRGPRLSAEKVAELAAEFAEAIPEREFSMATLQGYLMGYKIRPYDAIKDAPSWIEKERVEIAAKKGTNAVKTDVKAQKAELEDKKVES